MPLQPNQKRPVCEMRFPSIGKRARALMVGEWLRVSYADAEMENYRVYNLYGWPALPITFAKLVDALSVAEWLDKVYGEFFPIWEEYPKADIPAITKWTVKNGVDLYEMICEKA